MSKDFSPIINLLIYIYSILFSISIQLSKIYSSRNGWKERKRIILILNPRLSTPLPSDANLKRTRVCFSQVGAKKKKREKKRKTEQSNFRHPDTRFLSTPSIPWTCQENRSLVSEFDLTNSRFQTIKARLIRRDANRFPR